MHFTYERRKQGDDLKQGDVLKPTNTLHAALNSMYPSYTDAAIYPMFIIVTQSCDLVRRATRRGRSCKSPYVALAAVRLFSDVLQREVGKFQKDETETEFSLCRAEYRRRVEQFIERLLNNNAEGHFYLHGADAGEVSERMCAVLAEAIPLTAEEYYDTCVEARVVGLTPEFRAKLGWLVGAGYSRVATEDWVPGNMTQSSFNTMVRDIAGSSYAWPDRLAMKELKAGIKDGRVEARDPLAIAKFVEQSPTRQERVLEVIRRHLSGLPLPEGASEQIESVVRSIASDTGFTSVFAAD